MFRVNLRKQLLWLVISIIGAGFLFPTTFAQKPGKKDKINRIEQSDEIPLNIEPFRGKDVCSGQGLLKTPGPLDIKAVEDDFGNKGDFPVKVYKIGKENIYLFKSKQKATSEKLFEVFARLYPKEGIKKASGKVIIKEDLEPDFLARSDGIAEEADPDGLWGWNKIGTKTAWLNYSDGSDDLVIAVLDSGTFIDRFTNMIWKAPAGGYQLSFMGTNISCPENSDGFNFWGNPNLGTKLCRPDDNGKKSHGTSVAGIIGVKQNTGERVSGVVQHANIMSVKVLNRDEIGCASSIMAGIEFVIDSIPVVKKGKKSVRIINISATVSANSDEVTSFTSVIQRAEKEKLLIVSAAGKGGLDIKKYPVYPASFDLPNMIAVTASTEDENLVYMSNVGKCAVHLAAPGDRVNTARASSFTPYQRFSETSAAAPFVSGSAALVMSACPGLSIGEVRRALFDGADDSKPGITDYVMFGRLNVLEALKIAVKNPDCKKVSPKGTLF